MTMQRACVLIPGYNAAQTVGPLIRQIKAMGLDVVLIDDGSTDQTAKTATEAGARVMSHIHNQGKGSALRAGFSYALQAGYDMVVTLDSDGQHDPQDIPRLLEAAQQPPACPDTGVVAGREAGLPAPSRARLVIGDRLDRRAPSMPPVRRWTNRVMSWLVSRITRQRIPDSQSGFRVIPKALLSSITLSTRHFEIETELLLAAARAGWTVTSVPIRAIYAQQRSHIHPVVDSLRFLRLIVRYAWRPLTPSGSSRASEGSGGTTAPPARHGL